MDPDADTADETVVPVMLLVLLVAATLVVLLAVVLVMGAVEEDRMETDEDGMETGVTASIRAEVVGMRLGVAEREEVAGRVLEVAGRV